MDDDDVNLPDYDAKLHVGSVEIASVEEDHVPPELLPVFTDEMYRSRACEFVAPGPVIADRLDILGFTPTRVREALDGVLDECRRIIDLARQYGSDESMAADDAEWSRLAGYTANDWIAGLRAPARGSAPAGRPEPGSTGWLMSLIKDAGRRIALRAVLLARPDDEVRLDITYLVAMGALETTDALCSSGLKAMRAAASAHTPIVVLTEGKSDIEFLEPALRLLYPHLVDLIRFMDFGQRPSGGAGALVNTLKSFAAAGIANRVVALFDNDTAAADALRPLDRSRLPANVRVCQYSRSTLPSTTRRSGPLQRTLRSLTQTSTDSLVPSSCTSGETSSSARQASSGRFTGTPRYKACSSTKVRLWTRTPFMTPTARRSAPPTPTDPESPSRTGQVSTPSWI
jgi:hypothetical protein